MFTDILSFLLQVILSLLGTVFLFRAWLYFIRMPPFNPYSQGIFKVTDWAVVPIHKLLKNTRHLDTASLLCAWVCAFLYLISGWLLITGMGVPLDILPKVALAAVFTLIKWVLNISLWMILIQVILSWVNPTAPIMPLLLGLTRPIMEPVRKRLPNTGAFDFSPLVVLIAIQVLSMITQRITIGLLAI